MAKSLQNSDREIVLRILNTPDSEQLAEIKLTELSITVKDVQKTYGTKK